MVQVHDGTTAHPEAVALYRATLLPHCPASKGRGNPEPKPKFTYIPESITDRNIAALLDGSESWAALVIGADDMAWEGSVDIDHGGTPALERMFAAADRRRLIGFAIASDSGEHDGGHFRLLFDGPVKAEWLRALMVDLATEAGIEHPEVYPSGKLLRCALSIHPRTGKRGDLMLPDGTRRNLDTPGAVAEALGLIAALPRNSAALVPELSAPAPHPAPSTRALGPLGATERPIEAYNRATDLIALVESYGGRDAGGGLMHCPSPDHKHGDRNPSLHVRPARAAKFGSLICGCYAPGCRLHTEAGQVLGPFDVFCLLEGLSTAEAVRRITGTGTRAPRPTLSAPAPEQTPTQRAEATRKRREARQQTRSQEVTETLAQVRARADADTAMPPAARRTLGALFIGAGPERDWSRKSVPWLADAAGYKSERSVQSGLRWLEAAGYITATPTNGKGTWTWTFTRVQNVTPTPAAPEAPSAEIAPEYRASNNLRTPELLVSAPMQPEAEPADVDEWEGGASYDPAWSVLTVEQAPRRTWASGLTPKEHYVASGKAEADVHRRWADAWESAPLGAEPDSPEQAALGLDMGFTQPQLMAEPVPDPVRMVPPTEPEARRKYYKLRGKANKPGTPEAQRRALLRQAQTLEIVATEPLQPVVAQPTPVLTQIRHRGQIPVSPVVSLPGAVFFPSPPAVLSTTGTTDGCTGGGLQANSPSVPRKPPLPLDDPYFGYLLGVAAMFDRKGQPEDAARYRAQHAALTGGSYGSHGSHSVH